MVSVIKPLVLEEKRDDGEEGWRLAITDFLIDPPEVHVEIQSAPEQAKTAAYHRSQAIRGFLVGAVTLILAWTFSTPPVLKAAQWLYDFFTL